MPCSNDPSPSHYPFFHRKHYTSRSPSRPDAHTPSHFLSSGCNSSYLYSTFDSIRSRDGSASRLLPASSLGDMSIFHLHSRQTPSYLYCGKGSTGPFCIYSYCRPQYCRFSSASSHVCHNRHPCIPPCACTSLAWTTHTSFCGFTPYITEHIRPRPTICFFSSSHVSYRSHYFVFTPASFPFVTTSHVHISLALPLFPNFFLFHLTLDRGKTRLDTGIILFLEYYVLVQLIRPFLLLTCIERKFVNWTRWRCAALVNAYARVYGLNGTVAS